MAEDSGLASDYLNYINGLPVQILPRNGSLRPGSAGPIDKEDVDYFHNSRNEQDLFWFNRRHTEDPLVTGYNYLFITAPELPIHSGSPSLTGRYDSQRVSNISSGGAGDILQHNIKMLNLPSESGGAGNTIYSDYIVRCLAGLRPFIPILTNRATSYVMSDEVLGTIDYSETWNRYKIVLGTTGKDSRISGNFTINFMEDNFLTIMKLHRLWTEYIEKVFMGDCVSGGVLLSGDMLDNNIRTIDYMCSVYQFAVQPDGETLIHWCRYTGVMPTKVPWSELTSEDGSIDIKKAVPIEYQFSYKEDMSMYVLRDFTLLSGGTGLNSAQGGFFTGGDVSIPRSPSSDTNPSVIYAGQDDRTKMPIYKLVFPNNEQK